MKLISINKKAYHNYEILRTYETGIVLSGPEVKSAKAGKIDLVGGYVILDKEQIPWLINVKIAPYPPAKGVQESYQPTKLRKLLLKKKEISTLIGQTKIKGLTIVPLKVYNKHGIIKIEIGIARGKRKIDKREEVKKREIERKIKEELKFRI